MLPQALCLGLDVNHGVLEMLRGTMGLRVGECARGVVFVERHIYSVKPVVEYVRQLLCFRSSGALVSDQTSPVAAIVDVQGSQDGNTEENNE